MHQRRWHFIAVALALASLVLYGRPAPAQAQGAPPAPAVAKNTAVFAEWGPGAGRFISTVDNFAGLVAVANIQGTGKDDKGNTLTWEVDVRAIQGVYVDPGGVTQRGTFGFA